MLLCLPDCATAAGLGVSGYQVLNESDFIIALAKHADSGLSAGYVALRISGNACSSSPQPRFTDTRVADGHCSAILSHGHCALLCTEGRICGSHAEYNSMGHFIDAVTGAMLSRAAINYPVVDTSGALVWQDRDSAFIASSGPDSNGRVLAAVEPSGRVCRFRYGVCVILSGDECRVLRFDGA